jgi:hypothetical protein
MMEQEGKAEEEEEEYKLSSHIDTVIYSITESSLLCIYSLRENEYNERRK